MKPSQLRVFTSIADTGSLTNAAESLHRTAPAISKTLRELEESLRLRLFNRTASGMTLTSAGEALLPRARVVLRELERSAQDMATFRGEASGPMRIGISPATAFLVARALVMFRQEFPTLDIEVHDYANGSLHELVANGSLDIAFPAFPSIASIPAGVTATLLKSVKMSLATRRTGIYSNAVTLNDVKAATWVYVDPTGAQRAFVVEQFDNAGLEPPESSILCTSVMMAIVLASESDVILLLTHDTIGVYERELIPLSVFPAYPTLDYYSFLRPGGIPTIASAKFLQLVRETLREPITFYAHSKFLLSK